MRNELWMVGSIALMFVTANVVAPRAIAHQDHADHDVNEDPATLVPGRAEVQPGSSAPAQMNESETPLTNHAGKREEEPAGSPHSNLPYPLAWLGKFHPPSTHFPIALLLAGALAEFLYWHRGELVFRHAERFSIGVGATSAVGAALLGWMFAGIHLVDAEDVMTAHRWSASVTALVSLWLLVESERAAVDGVSRRRLRVALAIGAVLVSITGFLGGSLLYGLDHYAW